jgi:isopentenyl phosphate kinase
MILVKLGGSVLTNKGTAGSARFSRRVALRLLRELRQSGKPFVLVHGAGSFAHPLAMRYGIGKRRLSGNRLAAAVSRTQAGVRELRAHVLSACEKAGLPAIDVPAGVLGRAVGGKLVFEHAPIAGALEAGLVPVTGGDVILDDRLGARILSGDEILAELTSVLKPERVVFVSDVDGLRVGARVVEKLSVPEARRALPKIGGGRDATGGMKGKLLHMMTIAERGVPVVLVNGHATGRLGRACLGRRVLSTRIG